MHWESVPDFCALSKVEHMTIDEELPDDWSDVAKAYGFPEYSIDFGGVSYEDVIALIDFMRERINARTKENA